MVAGEVGVAVLSLTTLAVSFVQCCLLGFRVLLLALRISLGLLNPGNVPNLFLAEFPDLPALLSDHNLRNTTPVGGHALDQQPVTIACLYLISWSLKNCNYLNSETSLPVHTSMSVPVISLRGFSSSQS